ncbi:hypothetical protein M0802_009770 [Mischocyttarus mexicanus]|nr:hypothetical protein M0802_009770 [Mischocyttarus mexicanus]
MKGIKENSTYNVLARISIQQQTTKKSQKSHHFREGDSQDNNDDDDNDEDEDKDEDEDENDDERRDVSPEQCNRL